MYILHVYLTYLVVSLTVTIWVARTLHKNGRVFLVEAFQGNTELADSVNQLLVVGFYLINVGWVVSTVRAYGQTDTPREAIELVTTKIGNILLVLGGMHFLNLYIFNRFRRRGLERYLPPPLPPSYQMAPYPAPAVR
jgi:hypothetical protein